MFSEDDDDDLLGNAGERSRIKVNKLPASLRMIFEGVFAEPQKAVVPKNDLGQLSEADVQFVVNDDTKTDGVILEFTWHPPTLSAVESVEFFQASPMKWWHFTPGSHCSQKSTYFILVLIHTRALIFTLYMKVVCWRKAPYPLDHVPITGSAGEKNLLMLAERQMPPHDADPVLCHTLNEIELLEFAAISELRTAAKVVGQAGKLGPVGLDCAGCNTTIAAGAMSVQVDQKFLV